MYSNKKDNFQQDLLKIEIAKADLLKQEVDDSQFTVFDHATVQIVDQYKDTVEIETFRDAIKRIFELAGLNYELEKRRRKKDKGPLHQMEITAKQAAKIGPRHQGHRIKICSTYTVYQGA